MPYCAALISWIASPIIARGTDRTGSMTSSTWSALAVVCVLGAISPGPSLVVLMKHTINGSRMHGAVVAVAHGFGVAFYAMLSVLGLALVLTRHPALFTAVTASGAAFLAWTGVRLLLPSTSSVALDAAADNLHLVAAARDGLATSLTNPKLAVFFIALFSQFVSPNLASHEKIILVATPTGIDISWHLAATLIISQSWSLAWLRSHTLWLNRTMGFVLILLALRMFVDLLT
jgi:threonine/homoserine/homoserine lactone efflux protein